MAENCPKCGADFGALRQALDLEVEICRVGHEELAAARETNTRLNRRCQKLESDIAHNPAYNIGFAAGKAQARLEEPVQAVKDWQYVASRLGEKNIVLKRRLAEALAAKEKAETACAAEEPACEAAMDAHYTIVSAYYRARDQASQKVAREEGKEKT